MTRKTILKIGWRVLQVVLIGLIFYYLGSQLSSNWDQVKSYEWRFNYLKLFLALCSVLIAFFIFSSTWKMIMRSFGHNVGYRAAFKIAYLSNLGRYIPGKIWQMFGLIYLSKKEGISEEEAVTSFALTQIFAIPSGLLSGILFISFDRQLLAQYQGQAIITGGLGSVAFVIFLISLMVVFYPAIMERMVNWALRLIKRKQIKLNMNKTLAASIYGGYFLAWSVYGFSFWLFLGGITVMETGLFPMAGIFIIAYQIGYMMLFAPGGLGPREGVMTILLTPVFGVAAVAIPIASRLWLIVAEVISAVIALTIKKRS